jgi:hypothetical protein
MNRDEFEQDPDFQLLHKQYQLHCGELPPESVDERILRAAHHAVKESDSPVSQIMVKTSKPKWFVPASVAAVLVLSLSVVMKLAFEPVAEYEPAESPVVVDGALEKETRLELKTEEVEKAHLKHRMKMAQKQKNVAKAKRSKPQMNQLQAGTSPVLAGSVQQNESKKNNPVAATAAPVPESMKFMSVKPQQASEQTADSDFNDLVVIISSQQKKQLDRLMVLFEKGQFEELKLVMKAYRKKYPLSEHDSLPKQLRDLEIKWQSENDSKSLQAE